MQCDTKELIPFVIFRVTITEVSHIQWKNTIICVVLYAPKSGFILYYSATVIYLYHAI